jgi:hypothetical protein
VVGKHQVAQQVEAIRRGADVRLARVQPQPVRRPPLADGRAHRGETPLVVVESDHVIHVTQVGTDLEHLLGVVVEVVEVQVGEELAGQVADGNPPSALQGR